MTIHRLVLPTFFAVTLLAALGQSSQPAAKLPPVVRKYLEQQQEIQKLFSAGEYQKSADLCNELLKKYPKDANTFYNLACAQARLKQTAEAFDSLEKAVKNGWADAAHMQEDEDLAPLRDDKKFDGLVAQAKVNAGAGGKYEPGDDIPAVKTVEASPEGGLRYRLRFPKTATPEQPAKLIIWLHPSGGSMNKQIEKLSPDLAAHGYALMVATQKQFMSWNDHEINALLNQSLADVRTHKEIDAARPILMGFSAGGQVALMIWQQKPAAWSGLIVDAAYPVVPGPQGYAVMNLPADTTLLKKTPIHVVVGGKDPGSQIWQKMESKWLDAGIPLSVVIVPEKPHGWLITGDVLKETYTWLDEVKAGKLPADPAPAPATQSATLPATQPAIAP